MTYPKAFESAGIGTAYASTFESTGIGLFKFYSFMTYASAFKSAGTGSKNPGIGYIYIFIKAIPTQVKTPE